ncbi:PREDICTED: uncharacterized protein LOC104586575 [Nelumbo nucifera]|uniref:Uncharacterized protein LOC104586575 n=2 Tax=Nelumbo nucifera TaxID=4432 RepID=A0A1U7YSV1_NELNU|nr:PREDICTED: uncharacterized protein LOC104586575 [Nelumbo nucifera]DAD37756.1 TPA_asm: hypothetical protein HUJ06_008397 [Nelumbo nucifera]
MAFFKTIRAQHLYTFLRLQNTSKLIRKDLYTSPIVDSNFLVIPKPGPSFDLFNFKSFLRRTISASAQVEESFENESTDSEEDESNGKSERMQENSECVQKPVKESRKKMAKKVKKVLDVSLKEAVGSSEKPEESDDSSEKAELKEDELSGDSKLKEIEELKKKLRNLEREVRSLKANAKDKAKQRKEPKTEEDPRENVQTTPRSLYSLFANNRKPVPLELKDAERPRPHRKELSQKTRPPKKKLLPQTKPRYKEFSPDMASLVGRLYEEGYLDKANFFPEKKLDLSCFSKSYPREFLVSLAERFGRDHQEIARWLSGSDLKTVALFGCPSLAKDNVFAAKRLRTFFSVHEDTVCCACKLRSSCKFVNKKVLKVDHLNLADTMRILMVYSLDLFHPELVVPKETRASISRLLKEVINLSQ